MKNFARQVAAYQTIMIGVVWARLGVNGTIKYLKENAFFNPARGAIVYIVSPFDQAMQAIAVLRGIGCSSAVKGIVCEPEGKKPENILLYASTANDCDAPDFEGLIDIIQSRVKGPAIEFFALRMPPVGWDGYGRFGMPLKKDVFSTSKGDPREKKRKMAQNR